MTSPVTAAAGLGKAAVDTAAAATGGTAEALGGLARGAIGITQSEWTAAALCYGSECRCSYMLLSACLCAIRSVVPSLVRSALPCAHDTYTCKHSPCCGPQVW